MLVGTDYAPGGVKGIGPKNALKKVKEFGTNFEELFKDVKWSDFQEVPWTEVLDLFLNMPTTDNYELEWQKIKPDEIKKLLVDEYEFSESRVEKQLEAIKKIQDQGTQKGLSDFF